jgi:TRAP-type C4-dicarboxylate transport system permease small subunit
MDDEQRQIISQEVSTDKRELTGFHPVIVWICRFMTGVGSVVLAIMMFLSVADICGRFFFNKPIAGTYEIVSLMVVLVGVLGLGYCQLIKGNIMVDIVTKRFSPRGQAIMNTISYLISIGVCAIVTWQLSLRMWRYLHNPLGGRTIQLGILFWPFLLIMALCFAWVTVIFCIDLYHAFREVIKR